MTKTVTHSVIEEGYRDSITKTFYIDTNIHSNLETNKEFIVDPSTVIQITDWKFDTSKTISLPTSFNGIARGWKTQKESGYHPKPPLDRRGNRHSLFLPQKRGQGRAVA